MRISSVGKLQLFALFPAFSQPTTPMICKFHTPANCAFSIFVIVFAGCGSAVATIECVKFGRWNIARCSAMGRQGGGLRARCRHRCATWWITGCKCRHTAVSHCRTCAAVWWRRGCSFSPVLIDWLIDRLADWFVYLCRWMSKLAPYADRLLHQDLPGRTQLHVPRMYYLRAVFGQLISSWPTLFSHLSPQYLRYYSRSYFYSSQVWRMKRVSRLFITRTTHHFNTV